MTLFHHRERGTRCLFATESGAVTIPDLQVVVAIVRGEVGYACPELIDLRGASSDFATRQVCGLALWLEDFVKDHVLGPTAVVVATPVAFGMMRMLETLASSACTIRPFLNVDDAMRWLQEGAPA